MPLVFGVPTFDRVGACPTSPWADLCSLLADCVYENVVLVVDDRMRLIEEIARFIAIHRNDVPNNVLVKLTEFIATVHNAPHTRIPMNVHTPDVSWDDSPEQIAARVIASVGRPLDFEYAFPNKPDSITADGRPPVAQKSAENNPSLDALASTSMSSIPPADEMSSDMNLVTTGGPQGSAGDADVKSIPTLDKPLHADPIADATESTPLELPHADTEDTVSHNAMINATSVPGPSQLQPSHSAARDIEASMAERNMSHTQRSETIWRDNPLNQRANEYIPLGSYQASASIDLVRRCRAKTSFGDKHDVNTLSETLGRALWFTEEFTLLDSVVGTKLYLVKDGVPYDSQDDDIRRFIDSLSMYTAVADSVRATAFRPMLVLRTYCQPGKPGPTRRQIKHFEKLVESSTGFQFRCDVRVKVGGGISAHDRYLVVSHCCVELGGGSDVAYTQNGSGRKKTRPEKHFRFLPVMNVASHDSQGRMSDVQADLRRYDGARAYVHPQDRQGGPAFSRRR